MDAETGEIGGYRLLEEIGRGGFGVVYRAQAPGGGPAAVKLLHAGAGADPGLRETFAHEVAAARRVSPFCVARVLDADPHAERPWIASEFIEGRTLTQEIGARGPRRGADLHRLAVSTATALTAIHRAGVAHRDFKPDNIMMAPDGPRVIDFGIARSFENTAFQATAKVGTLRYMAPERLNDAPYLTPAVDVFSWGAVMVYAASGRHAFEGRTPVAVITRILTGDPDCSAVPEELRGLVVRCLDSEPDRRPTAHQVLNSLLGLGADDTDVETALVSGRTAATGAAGTLPTEDIRGVPTLRETLKLTEELPGPGVRPGRPYGFAGGWYRSLGGLAEAFHADTDAACELFGDPDERADLAAWIAEHPGDTGIDPDLLRRQPVDVELAVLRFVARVRPDLPPRYRGTDVGLSGARATAAGRADPLDDDVDLPLNAAEAAAGCDCREPGHPCRPGQGCDEYRRMIRAARSALALYLRESERYAAVLSPAEPRSRTAFDRRADGGLFLRAVLAPDEWRRAVGRDRDALDPSLRRYLPTEPPTGTPQPVWACHGLVVRVLRELLARLDSRHRKLSERIERREAFALALRRRNTQHTWARLIAAGAACLFALPLYFSDDRAVDAVTGMALTALLWSVFFLLGYALVMIAADSHKMLHPPPSDRMRKKYRSTRGWRNKARQAEEDAARLRRELVELDGVRERLPA
ncbi:serine/threonine-protein kinase [Streptomonospora nanhaiensis]|uniref:non-specific serine/threonine protein kinase n=1 Tax=Streptomonospora nanhaiensis TaxID=1323731 RepID=A0ABY6YGC3_9ACTN|nr:serine/threonine-protein kinase [Streptomonospora nanhaiensis]WAE71276.1 serine/threonine-protein kinase [Streptomonospora nanhaiensis]